MPAVAIPFAHPPRLSGIPEVDFAAMVDWMWSFYQSAIVQGGLVQNIGLGDELQDQFPRLYNLHALGGVTANRLPYFTGETTWAITPITALARALLDDETQSEAQNTLGVASANDPELLAIAALTSAADKLPYYTGPGTAALADFTAYARTLVDDPDAPTARATLGLGSIATEIYAIGTWSPAFTNLTEVPGGGTITKTGRFTRLGRIVKFQVRISTTGGATTAATAGSTYHDLPISAVQDDVCVAANRSTNVGIGTGAVDGTNSRVYVPGWSATSNTIVISGTYEA